jgi:hypothetical protein
MKNTKKMEMLLNVMESLKENASDLRSEVLDILENHIEDCENFEEVRGFMEDLRSNGCVSGMIGELIYYSDTKKFFIENIDEIQDYVNELMLEHVYSINELDINEISWIVFESIANEYFYTIDDEMDNIEAEEEL